MTEWECMLCKALGRARNAQMIEEHGFICCTNSPIAA